MSIDSIKEITNEQRHSFFRRMALFTYELAVLALSKAKDDDELEKSKEDIEIAKAELDREGIAVPETVEPVKPSVNHYRRVANKYGGSWLIVEAVTDMTIEEYDKGTEYSDFIDVCKKVAEVNADFLQTALGVVMEKQG